ncbi:MAG: GH3 auxin-responsive promoter family protein [Bacteroidota bacterium]
MPLVNSLVSWYLKKRVPFIDRIMLYPLEVQEEQFNKIIKFAQLTYFGTKHNFSTIKNISDFKKNVPITNYEGYKPYLEKILEGKQNVAWPSDIKWFAKSSGTTSDKSKFIPVTYESLDECHFQGGKDALLFYLLQNPESNLFDGKGLVIGGSNNVNKLNDESFYGDLSAVMMQNMPFWAQYLRTPELAIALMNNWDEKVEKMARATLSENVTNMSGVPTWTIVLIEKLYEITGKNCLTDIWPNMELYIHGGVSFTPYHDRFKRLIKSNQVNFLETYNASEGFFGIQDDLNRDDMLLMLDYGVFYEFMPMTEYGKETPKTYIISEVNLNENYALVISTNAGLWRYVVGDTIKFTSIKPYRFKITGRTKHFINAFGEELMIENADNAISRACKNLSAHIVDYTAAPIYMDEKQKGGHEWLIEFDKMPDNLEQFAVYLDNYLKENNSDYEAKRYKDLAMQLPKIHAIPKGTFINWLKNKQKLGGQHKVPRLSNNRDILEEILNTMSEVI